MSTGSWDLERLISRYIDAEATPEEQRALEERADADPTLESLLIETAALDREIGRAMRIAMGRTIPLPSRRWNKARLIQVVGFAAAACFALLVYVNTSQKPGQPVRTEAAAPARASWFAPPAARADAVDTVDPADVRPQLRLRDTDRHWIVIPARQPGHFLLIQMDRLRTRAIRIQDDF